MGDLTNLGGKGLMGEKFARDECAAMGERRDAAGAKTAERAANEGAATGGFLPLRVLCRRAGAVLGLACLFAWVEVLLCFEGVLRDLVEYEGGLVHDPFFRAMTLTAALAFAVNAALTHSARVSQAMAGLLERRAVVGVAGAVGALSSAVPTLLADFAPECAPVSLACGFAAGLFVVCLTLMWGRELARLDLREALLLVSGAFCLQWMPLVAVPSLGTLAKAALVALLAVASCVMLARERLARLGQVASPGPAGATSGFHQPMSGSGWRGAGCGSTASTSCGQQPASRSGRHATGCGSAAVASRTRQPAAGAMPTKLAAMSATMLAFSLVTQFIWCFFIKMLPGRLDVSLFPGIFVLVVAVTAAVVAWAVFVMERQGAYRLELLYRATMLLTLCGVAATSVAAANESSAQLFAMYVLVYLGYSLLGPTMWLLALGYARMCRAQVATVLGSVFGCKFMGLFVGFEVAGGLQAAGLEPQGPSIVTMVTLVCIAVVSAAYLLVFPERELLSLSPLLFGMSSESLDMRCAQIAAERGLTPRETEVFTLLARGRDVGYICEELYIARNTANVHRKSIYTKLGIHSQQDLLSLVEGGR